MWHLVPFVDLDGELVVHPNAGVSGFKLQGFLGAKMGARLRHVGAFVKVRPGFLFFLKDPFGVGRRGDTFLIPTGPTVSIRRSTSAASSSVLHALASMIVRFDLGDTIVRFRPRTVAGSQFEPPRQVAGFTTRNRQWSLGVGKRFLV